MNQIMRPPELTVGPLLGIVKSKFYKNSKAVPISTNKTNETQKTGRSSKSEDEALEETMKKSDDVDERGTKLRDRDKNEANRIAVVDRCPDEHGTLVSDDLTSILMQEDLQPTQAN